MIKSDTKSLILFFLGIVILSSCANEKKLVYFQDPTNRQDTVLIAPQYVPKIQTGDILSIYVNSLSPEASSFFNPYSAGASASSTVSASGGTGTGNGAPSQALTQTSSPGYLVDPAGDIELPLLGSIKVSNLTTSQVRDTLKTLLKTYLKEPTILVRFLNFKISILGEVARPNVYNIPNEMITLPEALSIAGDMTPFGRRDSVLIIRETNGKKEFGVVNLNKRDLFSSPYYYLHSNDLVYVKPSKIRIEQASKTTQYIAVAASLLSLIVVLVRNL
jgi:polysaccharide export outer membrane protein